MRTNLVKNSYNFEQNERSFLQNQIIEANSGSNSSDNNSSSRNQIIAHEKVRRDKNGQVLRRSIVGLDRSYESHIAQEKWKKKVLE